MNNDTGYRMQEGYHHSFLSETGHGTDDVFAVVHALVATEDALH
jgi:hypothetical protein